MSIFVRTARKTLILERVYPRKKKGSNLNVPIATAKRPSRFLAVSLSLPQAVEEAIVLPLCQDAGQFVALGFVNKAKLNSK
jgi:hypothetical protein